MTKPKIWHSASAYLSHARVARDYCDIIAERFELTDDPQAAEIVYLHDEPQTYAALLRAVPALMDKYVLAYAVWEADALPLPHRQGIAMLDEVWTASSYCQRTLAKYHPRVIRIPHVVARDRDVSAADQECVDALIGQRDARFCYFTIGRSNDARKQVPMVLNAFRTLQRRLPEIRLIVKVLNWQHGANALPEAQEHNGITTITGRLTEGAITALYNACDAYVSAHCAEGWGLTMSDAMLLGKPVIATAYSGNLDFMTPENSFLVACDETTIRPQDTSGSFTSAMRWAYPHQESLEAEMLRAHGMHAAGTLHEKTHRAAHDIALYDHAHVATLVSERLLAIHAGLRSGALRPGSLAQRPVRQRPTS